MLSNETRAATLGTAQSTCMPLPCHVECGTMLLPGAAGN